MAFRGGSDTNHKGRTPPPDDTHQEANYLKMLGEKQKPVRIKLMSGEIVRGWIEYYDRRMVRLTREGAPNLFIFKHEIAYIAEDTVRKPRAEGAAVPRNGGPERQRMSVYLPEVEQIAREAGALLMGYFARRVTIEYKGDVDLVTEADRASEKLIVERLQARWPEHGIVGEEGTRSEADAEYRWYVDPLDGTTNFAHGYPVFCVSIALTRRDGQLEAGVLYDPTRDEMFSAERGEGATLNGKQAASIEDQVTVGISAGNRLPQSQAAQESQHPLLSPAHAALARSASRRFGRARPRQRRLRTLRRLLGIQSQSLGHRRRRAFGAGSRWHGNALRRNTLPPRQPRGARFSNGLIHQELLQNFAEMFAGRGLEELPSVAEYVKTRT